MGDLFRSSAALLDILVEVNCVAVLKERRDYGRAQDGLVIRPPFTRRLSAMGWPPNITHTRFEGASSCKVWAWSAPGHHLSCLLSAIHNSTQPAGEFLFSDV
jgi:hypothetical protein